MADFPESVKNFLVINDGVDKVVAAHPNDRAGEITAVETFLGGLGAGNTQGFSAALVDLLQGYRSGALLTYVGAEELSVAAGRIAFEASGKFRWRENSAATSVDWSNLDTGVEANNTYYVYAVADSSGTGFTVLISLSASTPTGGTYYKRLGSFINSTDIIKSSVYDDSASARIKTGTYIGDGATSQAITGVGFLPEYVKIWPSVANGAVSNAFETTTTMMLDDGAGGAYRDLDNTFFNNRIIALGTDGFTVDDQGTDGDPNKNGQVYNYICMG